MLSRVSVIGGDLRIANLTELLAKDGSKIYTYALEKANNLENLKHIEQCKNIEDLISKSEIIIGPVPLSSDNVNINTPFSDTKITIEKFIPKLEGKTFIAGSIKQEVYNLAEGKNIKIIDLLNREELVVLNAISTAEGAIQIAMEETVRTIHGSNILIMGFGRIGKILANALRGIGANVYCEARKNEDLAWIKAYGYKPINLNELHKYLNKFHIIMNTIPSLVLDEQKLCLLNKDCLIIDLASSPGGIDRNAANKIGIKTIWALSLPGKVAPLASAEFIKDTIYNVLKEL